MTRKVECQRSRHHGHHDASEPCPMCEPPAEEVTRELPAYDANAWNWVDAMLTYQCAQRGK